MRKKILFSVLFFIFVSSSLFSYADDESIGENVTSEEIAQTIETTSNKISSEPIINARHAIIFDRHSNQVIYGKKDTEICKMASTTKIMTAVIVLENADLNDIVKVSSKSASIGGSRLGLSTNDSITVENLLYGLMLKSGNDAAVALAEHVSGTVENFAILMNQKAKDLNLVSTSFVTPHGLDNNNHYTTAFDLAKLTDYALKNEMFAKIVRTKTYTITLNNYPKTLLNTNELLGNFDGVYGVKTGFTNGANRCLVTACKKNGLDVICIVLGCDTKKDRTKDSIKLLNYTFNYFNLVNVKDIIEKDFKEWALLHKNSFKINKGISQTLALKLDENDFKFINIAVKNPENISTEITFDSYYDAPLYSFSKIGKIVLKVNENYCFSVNIINCNNIKRKNAIDYFVDIIKNYKNCFIP